MSFISSSQVEEHKTSQAAIVMVVVVVAAANHVWETKKRSRREKKFIHLYKDTKKECVPKVKCVRQNSMLKLTWNEFCAYNEDGKKIMQKKLFIIIIFIFTTKSCLNYPSQGMWRWLQFALTDWQWYDFFGVTFVVLPQKKDRQSEKKVHVCAMHKMMVAFRHDDHGVGHKC